MGLSVCIDQISKDVLSELFCFVLIGWGIIMFARVIKYIYQVMDNDIDIKIHRESHSSQVPSAFQIEGRADGLAPPVAAE